MSENYVRAKTIAITLHKDVVPSKYGGRVNTEMPEGNAANPAEPQAAK